MDFDFNKIERATRSKLLSSTIVPRPIAWVVSMNSEGQLNAAPFSFFNLICTDPPLVCVSVTRGLANRAKDTGENIRSRGEFVVNLVNYDSRNAMNICGTDFPPEVNELEKAGLKTIASSQVAPPRIAGCPASYECRVEQILDIGCTLVIGRVVHMHLDDNLILDREKMYVDTPRMDLVARMHGRGWYARTTALFEMPRIPLDEA
jgi:flavin reductase (DIM6/NTAB) family NADH-FMN oxidoreductase RutF